MRPSGVREALEALEALELEHEALVVRRQDAEALEFEHEALVVRRQDAELRASRSASCAFFARSSSVNFVSSLS